MHVSIHYMTRGTFDMGLISIFDTEHGWTRQDPFMELISHHQAMRSKWNHTKLVIYIFTLPIKLCS
jgi:hypothetical protein